METKETPKILVIYTGGTIGMKKVNGVLVPVKHYLPDFISKTPTVYGKPADSIEGLSTFDLINQDGSHILYSMLEWECIKDSSNIAAADWVHMVEDILRYYSVFNGFVILHGTDTMAYTASALSFMLDNLSKPVVITGSQIPLSEFRSDGENNMLGALAMASYSRPEDGLVIAEVKAHLQTDIKGVVFMTYGAGNFPSDRKDILNAIKEAVEGGKLIVNCTQCPNGQVTPAYETGQEDFPCLFMCYQAFTRGLFIFREVF
ncbi:L-asparaginase-like [Diadema antillarum]|uniref:L-asparaginase-like n=1 Tax=Diadema antillarum TaxID=105358 RepID=UPI003A836F72